MEREDCRRPHGRGRYLIQRVIGQGRLERRCLRVNLCPPCGSLPCGERAVLTCARAGEPRYEELPCHERGAMLLRVVVPLALTVCVDGRECAVPSETTQTLRIRLFCPAEECWRHRVILRAAARLCRRACLCDDGCFDAAIDLCVEGYIAADCVIGAPDCDPCPPRLPLYPPPCGRGCDDPCDIPCDIR